MSEPKIDDPKVDVIEYDGKFTIEYWQSNGTSSAFRVDRPMAWAMGIAFRIASGTYFSSMWLQPCQVTIEQLNISDPYFFDERKPWRVYISDPGA